ncbi:MAG: DEAD/DEAH box helicase family protein [Nitrososphaerota archaeon]|nr:DEAD/DEAH box helicase family protein [Nitrososphaerota archaeon]
MPGKKAEKSKFHLSEHLILTRFVALKLGFKDWVQMLRRFADVPEGNAADGYTFMYHKLLTSPGRSVPDETLAAYDRNIRGYVVSVGRKRGDGFRLKYFQYLAVLFTEIYLDLYFQGPISLMRELNDALENDLSMLPRLGVAYGKRDLQKVAYAMATGSGKTLLLHINYLQFQRYNHGRNAIDVDNVVLIAPSEEMANQHLDELLASGIPAEIFKGETPGPFVTSEGVRVKVIDVFKLKLPEDKKGEGVTFNVDIFGEKNLLFVDEGHKGNRSEERKWKQVRQKLSRSGFSFEYSATFSQVIGHKSVKDANGNDLLDEYSKAILFDYSYNYFHGDGYGKEFFVLNLKKFEEEDRDTVLLSNLLSYYEQLLVYSSLGERAGEYRIERPLWIFVGQRVKDETSDMVTVLSFLDRILENKGGWVEKRVHEILEGRSGLRFDELRDVLARGYSERHFPYLRQAKMQARDIVKGILGMVFHAAEGGPRPRLHVQDLRSARGEFLLRATTSSQPFGLIYVGNKLDLKKALNVTQPDINVENDVVGPPMFQGINDDSSPLNVLIGAKKFIEGWNCWRVSSMTLINIGRGEGPQIVQLFGRGVRLHGWGGSLKRTSQSDNSRPRFIEILETLGVYGIRADYMQEFRAMIEREDLPALEAIEVPVKPLEPFPHGLKIPELPPGADFQLEDLFELTDKTLDAVQSRVDILPRVDFADSRTSEGIRDVSPPTRQGIRESWLALLDWDEVYLDALHHWSERDYSNLRFSPDDVADYFREGKYELYANARDMDLRNEFARLTKIQEIAGRIIRNLIDRRYEVRNKRWEKERRVSIDLTPDSVTMRVGSGAKYTAWIDSSRDQDSKEMKRQVTSGDVYRQSVGSPFPTAWYDGHLFQPLFAIGPGNGQTMFTEPAGLNMGESRFVVDLANYLKTNLKSLGGGTTVYLMRNFTKGKGVGFEVPVPFYPDFLLWVVRDREQRLAFVDPHGLSFSGSGDPKVSLHRILAEEPPNWAGIKKVDAYIVSVTPFNEVSSRFGHAPATIEAYAKDLGILFQDRERGQPNSSYMRQFFDSLMSDGPSKT